MPRRTKTPIDPRKKPQQARSTELVAAILEAAIRVLEREGARRFTTIRVAAAAGVSVGSLYQYFPNKEAILFRLQVDEWARTSALLDGIFADRSLPPPERLRAVMRAFFASERDEAPLRLALDALGPTFADAPEALAVRARSERIARAFVREAAPHASPAEQRFAMSLLMMTMGALGKEVSELDLSPAARDRWADAVAAMLMGHLATLDRRRLER